MSRDEAMERLEQLGWEPAATVEHTLLEKKSILHELGQSERVHRTESKEQDRAERSVQGPQHSIVGTRDETTADKEDQRGTSRTRTIATGNPGIRTTPREDGPRQSVLRVGGADTRRGRCYSVATAKEVSVACGTVTENVAPTTKAAQSNTEAGAKGRTGRLGETSGTLASDGSTTEDDSDVQYNLKTMNEQQRAMLRKNGKQLFKIDQLTTSEAGHADLAEIGNVGQSEILSTCELLGGRMNTANLTRYWM